MSNVLFTESESEDIRHGEDENAETRTVEFLPEATECACTRSCRCKGKLKPIATMETVVCSCGSTMCYAIGIFGHPRPIYAKEIEPIPGQMAKDRRAVALKGGE